MSPAPSNGTLLIAAPWLRDPNFARSVVLVCACNDEGTMGLVLNRPLEMTLGDGLAKVVAASRSEVVLYGGGPVASASLFALHDVPRLAGESSDVVAGVRFMPGTDALVALLGESPSAGEVLRLFAGCAGWSAGQLEGEIDEHAWILGRATAGLVFTARPATLWERALRAIGPAEALLATMPEDPRVN